MMLRQIPNLLTLLRLLLVPPVVFLLLERRFAEAAGWFALAALSDLLDGQLARRFGWSSRLGGLLDPLADKLLVNGCFLALWWIGEISGWLPGLVLARDVVILAGAGAYAARIGPLQPEPTLLGKLNTVGQMLFLGLVMLDLGLTAEPSHWWSAGVLAIVLLTVASGVDYVVRWSLRARDARGKTP